MIRSHVLALGLLLAGIATQGALAEETAAAKPAGDTVPAAGQSGAAGKPEAEDPAAAALRRKLSALPSQGSDEESKERAALSAFYEARANAPLWVTDQGLTPKGTAVAAEIGSAGAWGLDAKDFSLPQIQPRGKTSSDLPPEAIADAELTLSLAVLKYARYARGGRIIDPTTLLNSHLDRKPQLLEPKAVLDGIASAEAADAYLRGLHPRHAQFEKLRQAYLSARPGATAKKLLANMEAWRWMPDDLGELHILANVPEFMLRLVKNGETIHTERIVAGEIGKQTTIFTRPLKNIVFKPMWRVPESIKVRELWPSLRRGGGLFRQYGLQLETKDGQPLDYRSIDWQKADIRDYEVVQPPGRKSVMGLVKFSFPSQHTIFMHDTPDKWMFAHSRRTLSHGCLRLRNPMRLAELVLAEDKGWDAARVNETARTGPLNNEIVMDRKIPMHLVYFTAWVDDKGAVRSFADVYGHEKRITLALEGKWDRIAVGRDHLAPVEPVASELSAPAPVAGSSAKERSIVDLVGASLGRGF